MAKMSTEELIGVFEELTVLELKEFLDAFEERFDVTAAAPMAVAAAPAAGGEPVARARPNIFRGPDKLFSTCPRGPDPLARRTPVSH